MSFEYVRNKKEFIRKYGDIKLLQSINEIWHTVKEQDIIYFGVRKTELQSLFKGNFWTTGYHRDDEDPEEIENWSELDEILTLTEKFTDILCGYYEKTNIKSEFYPFVYARKIAPGFRTVTFENKMGLTVPYSQFDLMGGFDRKKPEKNESIFNDDIKYLFKKKSDSKPGLASEDLKLKRLNSLMQENLIKHQIISMCPNYVIYPVIRLGVSKNGYLGGFWTLRKTL